jgi:uncharacterized protein (TIGR03435 family)
MRVILSAILGVAGSAALLAQTAPARPGFEVASIKPSAALAGAQVHAGVQVDGAQVHCTFLSVRDYIRIAYKVKDYHQVAGPDWMASDRYDIHAKLPSGATREQVPEMLQTLLEERFQIKLHRASKEFPAYGLVAGKSGLKLKESPLDPESEGTAGGRGALHVNATGGAQGTTINFGRGAYFTLANDRFEARKLTMTQLADSLGRFVERPVVDMTELKGTYDLTLEFTPEDYRVLLIRTALSAGVALPPEAMQFLDGASDESIFKGLQALGLKLEPRKAPLEVLVIDSAAKTPIEN